MFLVQCIDYWSCLDFGWQTRSLLLLTEDSLEQKWKMIWWGRCTNSFHLYWPSSSIFILSFYFFLWTSLRCVQMYKSSRKWIENLGMEQGYLHCLVLSCFPSLSWISHPRNHALLTKTKFHQSMKSSFESSSTWEGTCFCWIICLSHYALGRLD